MGFVSKLGHWLDTRFPERISADEVYRSLTAYTGVATQVIRLEANLKTIEQRLLAFETGARSFDEALKLQKDKLHTLETVMKMRPQTPVTLNGKEPWKR